LLEINHAVGKLRHDVIDDIGGKYHHLRQQYHENDAKHGAHDGADATDDDHAKKLDRQHQIETGGRDIAQVMGEQGATNAGVKRRNRKRQDAVLVEVDTHDFGRQVMVAQRHKGTAVTGALEIAGQQQAR